MKFGPFEFKFSPTKKTYAELDAIIRRQTTGDVVALKKQPKAQLQEYRSWVYSCVNLITDRISTLPFSFYRKSTGEELTRTNKNYKIFTKPFYKPNELMSFRFIRSWCQVQLDLCGMTVLWKGVNALGNVWEIWPLNMNDFVKVDVTDSIINPQVKYTFRSGTGFITFDESELIVINYINPTDPWTGASPIQAQAYATDIDKYIEIYERDFFKNSARIDFALSTDEAIDQDKADEIKARWKEKYQGSFHDVAVLDSGLKPVPLNYANRDFEFLNLAQWTREKVCAAYRVPKSKLGFADGNRASDVQTDIAFNREAIQPRLSMWDEELTMGICASFNDDIEFKHSNPIPRDRQIETQEARLYVGIPTMTLNEFRKETHKLPPIDGGDEIYVPKDYVRLQDVSKLVDAQIAMQNQTTQDPEDRDRDNEPDSHVNPDGSDDRDDNPTEGRSIDLFSNDYFKYLYDRLREPTSNYIKNELSATSFENFDTVLKNIFSEITMQTVVQMLDHFGEKAIKCDGNDWILPMVDKVVAEYKNTLLKNPKYKEQEWSEYISLQFDYNPRLSKITNSLSKACINYAKWLIFNASGDEIKWCINSNECGHKGKLVKFESKDGFVIGNKRQRFPNEVLSFSCDCTIVKN
jgi:HK97 family phage portal protein